MKRTSNAIVRPVAAPDVPAVVSLVAEVLREFGLTFGIGSPTDAQLQNLPESYESAGGAFWVAIGDDGSLLGTAGLYPVEDGAFELRKMYLSPRARGLGLGQRLLEECTRWAEGRQARRIVLDTIEEMTTAINFYEANGFRRDDNQKRAARCSRGYVKDL